MMEALTFIICKAPETDMLVTVFEDGEDQTADPATDSDQLHSFDSSYRVLQNVCNTA